MKKNKKREARECELLFLIYYCDESDKLGTKVRRKAR